MCAESCRGSLAALYIYESIPRSDSSLSLLVPVETDCCGEWFFFIKKKMYAALIECSFWQDKVFEATLINLCTLAVQHWSCQLIVPSNEEIDWDSTATENSVEEDGDFDPPQMRAMLNNAVSKFKFIFACGKKSTLAFEKMLVGRTIFDITDFGCPMPYEFSHCAGTECTSFFCAMCSMSSSSANSRLAISTWISSAAISRKAGNIGA